MNSTRFRDLNLGRYSGGILLVVILLAVCLRLLGLSQQPLWYDEAVTFTRASMDLSEAWRVTVETDSHPPFYYAIVRGFLVFGDTEVALRLFSVLSGILIVVLAFDFGRILSGTTAGLTAALLVAVSPLLIYYSQEARMYSLLAFGATLASWAAVRLVSGWSAWEQMNDRPPRRDIWLSFLYVTGALGALLAHNSGPVFLFAINLAMLWPILSCAKWRWQCAAHWSILQILTLAVWFLWLPHLLHQASSGIPDWIQVGPSTLIQVLNDFWLFGVWKPRTLLLPVLVGIFVWGVFLLRKQPWWAAFLVTLILTPIIVLYVLSTWKPILVTRSVLYAAVPFLVLTAIVAVRIRPRILGFGLIAGILFLNVWSLHNYYSFYEKERWDLVANHIADSWRDGDSVAVLPGYLSKALDYYWKRTGRSDELGRLSIVNGELSTDAKELAQEFVADGRRLWLVQSRQQPHGRDSLAAKKIGDWGNLSNYWQFRGNGYELNCNTTCIELFLFD
ncbi:MAG: hypothetical protein N838_29755 [Thiohalocapsa sp. PB-PSB1]|jgi:mannosyltransferase|nr:MAG: hypothetical protein N838_03080 [Thiohalocapsa sp. PB-PSB1]QQO56922.1 MAG: hypothetical protein N838_29755 [Thiohalocapsa sp. PB-PSB1]HCS91863.1 hypothetical protein [Chromatiaceae bacterium]